MGRTFGKGPQTLSYEFWSSEPHFWVFEEFGPPFVNFQNAAQILLDLGF
jgi:hypothetical protein